MLRPGLGWSSKVAIVAYRRVGPVSSGSVFLDSSCNGCVLSRASSASSGRRSIPGDIDRKVRPAPATSRAYRLPSDHTSRGDEQLQVGIIGDHQPAPLDITDRVFD